MKSLDGSLSGPKDFLLRYRSLIMPALFFAIAGLLYLPLINHTGYYSDDWYTMYAAKVAGPQIFHQIYILESRPGRALVAIPLYWLFRGVPFYYALSAYFFRTIGALTFLWLLRMMWPGNQKETCVAALLFLVYPGFLSQPTPVDYQSYLVGIWVGFLSLALTVKSALVSNHLQRIFLSLGAVLSGWFYLAQIEYYIGFEAVRIALIVMIFLRKRGDWKQTAAAAFRFWLPFAVIPAVFLTWRLFIFDNTRRATDAGVQLGRLISTPVHTSLTWLISFLQDVANVTLLAWTVPLNQFAFGLELRDTLIALGLSLLVLTLFFSFFRTLNNKPDGEKVSTSDFETEALWLGLIWVVLGLLPIVLGNRQVVFPNYSRYGFVSAGGAVVLLVALIGRFSGERFRRVVIGLLLLSATLTHYANAVWYADQVDDMRSFWWQVSWRVPQFERGTTIVVHYPNGGIREPSFVWGPANQIYYPFRLQPDAVNTGISAILLDRDAVVKILNKDKFYMDPYYVVTAYPNPRHITILTEPAPGSCVQVIDGDAPEYSRYEDPMFLAIGSRSRTDQILTQHAFPAVPEYLFGSEPVHGWCYYYEKAALARQQGNWNEVLQLADEAWGRNLKPNDLIEWMPFLQAYALNGRMDRLIGLSGEIQSDEYVARQACQRLTSLQTNAEVQALIAARYCVTP